jgi:peptidoglycan/LPS O-acetylase OafA/YrhL
LSAASQPSTIPQGARLHALDGLRGAAAVVVVAFHVIGQTRLSDAVASLLLASPFGLLVNGPGAVHVFFVLSGYVLALTLSRDTRPGRLARFYVRRWFRIQPPYMAAVLFAWAVSQWVMPVGAQATGAPWVRLPAQALPIALFFPSMAFGLLPVGWSLFIELAMSAVFPLLFLLGRRVHPLLPIALGLALLHEFDPRWRFLRFAIDFAIGFALFAGAGGIARFVQRFPRSVPAIAGVAGIALLQLPFAIGFAHTGFAGIEQGHSPSAIVPFALGSALLIITALHAPALRRALSTPLASFFGRVSYSLYLVHYSVMICFVLRFPDYRFEWPVALLVFAATLAISSALSELGYRAVELPSIRAGRALIRAAERFAGRMPRSPEDSA